MCYASMEMSAPIRFGTEGFRGVIAREFTFATLHRLAEAYGRMYWLGEDPEQARRIPWESAPGPGDGV